MTASVLRPLTRIDCVDLFPRLLDELLSLLRGLGDDDWQRPTVAGAWRVRDVAVHLLDGDLRRLSLARDGHRMAVEPIAGYADVLRLINGLNASGVSYGGRLSTRVITELLAVTGAWVSDYFASLDPEGDAVFPVDWAGESRSAHWMDIARDYTERWHHQMQIRDAVGAPLLLQRDWFDPLIDTSVRALPRTFGRLSAPAGASVVMAIDADRPRHFSLLRGEAAWSIQEGEATAPTASVTLDADTAWRLLYNALSKDEARRRIRVTGDTSYVEPLLESRSVMV